MYQDQSRLGISSIHGANQSMYQDLVNQSSKIDGDYNQIKSQFQGKDYNLNARQYQNMQNTRSQIGITQDKSDQEANRLFVDLEKTKYKDAAFNTDVSLVEKTIGDLDKGGMKFLSPADITKKYNYQTLISERKQTQQKEKIYLKRLQDFKQSYLLHQQQMQNSSFVDRDFERNKREEILKLQLQSEQIEVDKAKFYRDFESTKQGIPNDKTKFQSVAQRLLSDTNNLSNQEYNILQSKLADDERRINQMKRQQMNDRAIKDDDIDDILTNGATDNYFQSAKYTYEGAKINNNPADKLVALSRLREQLEDYNLKKSKGEKIDFILPIKEVFTRNQEPDQSGDPIRMQMNDFGQLRKDYIDAGGSDPNFLMNLSNLQVNFSNNPALNQSTIPKNYQSYPNLPASSPQKPYMNQTNQSYSSQQQPNMSQSSVPMKQLALANLSTHPIYEYLPPSFKRELLDLENDNQNLKQNPMLPMDMFRAQQPNKDGSGDGDQRMLDYLRAQEADLLLAMSRQDQRTPQYQQLLNKFQEIQNLKAVIEKAILDKRIMEAMKGNQGNDTRYNKSVVAMNSAQFHQLQSASHQMPMHYSQSEGFVIHWDFQTHLSIIYKLIRINYGIFRKGSDMYAYRQTEDHQCQFESFRSNKSIILERELLRDIDAYEDHYLYIEVWGYYEQNGKQDVIGWTLLNLFNSLGQLLTGRFRIPLYSQQFNPNELFKQQLPYAGEHKLYMRISLPGDPIMDNSDNILIENEYHVPDMHIHSSAHLLELAKVDTVYPRMVIPETPIKEEPQPRITLSRAVSRFNVKDTPVSNINPTIETPKSLPPSSIRSRFTANKKETLLKTEQTPGSRQPTSIMSRNQSRTPTSIKKEENTLLFRLLRLRNVTTSQYKQMRLKLGIFIGNKMLEDAYQVPQMTQMELDPVDSDDLSFQFKLNHQFSVILEEVFNKYDPDTLKDTYFFIGFFKNEKTLFGWLAIPLFFQDLNTQEFRVKSGKYSENLLTPPGQSPPFDFSKMKKNNIAVDFIINQSDETSPQLEAKNNYAPLEVVEIVSPSKRKNVKKAVEKKERKYLKNPKWNTEIHVDLIMLKNFPGKKNLVARVAMLCKEEMIQDVFERGCLVQQQIEAFDTPNKNIFNCNHSMVFRLGSLYLRDTFPSNLKDVVVFFSFFEGEKLLGIIQWPLFSKYLEMYSGQQNLPLYLLDKKGQQGSKTQMEIRFELFEDALKMDYVDLTPKNQKNEEEQYAIPRAIKEDKNKKLAVRINFLKNITIDGAIKLVFGIYRNSELIQDSRENDCEKEIQINSRKDKTIEIQVQEQKIINKLNLFFYLPIQAIIKQGSQSEFQLLFEFYDNKTFEVGYFAQNLFFGGKLNSGDFSQEVFKPPVKKCPVDFKNVKKSAIKLEFSINYEAAQELDSVNESEDYGNASKRSANSPRSKGATSSRSKVAPSPTSRSKVPPSPTRSRGPNSPSRSNTLSPSRFVPPSPSRSKGASKTIIGGRR